MRLFYLRYAISYRDLEEIMQERGVIVDHATLTRWVAGLLGCWVAGHSPLIAAQAKKQKSKVATSWRMDETYIKGKNKWVYLYRAIDKHGDTIDFILPKAQDEAAATSYLR